ncbi:50S ribosomal protein L7/L12 [Thraustotheca clavata]|uniref:50S ribosomal protein L7/L12 n=1 Tax=Thraustotheca clavata TaxID=74557 RepID=A0A1V9Z9X2_9STRA|nr:50S ribosomal protein L7/L12 [Thraustotheca clavata]
MLARVVRQSFRSRRCISSSFPRFLEVKEATEEQKYMMENEMAISPRVQAALDAICELNMLEIHELSQAVQIKFDIADMGMAIGGGGAAAPVQEEVKEEKTSFDVKLVSFDAKNKIKVIKEIRAITGLGLKEAKELVEGVPAVLKKDVKKAEADELLAKIAEIGGVGELE